MKSFLEEESSVALANEVSVDIFVDENKISFFLSFMEMSVDCAGPFL